MTENGNMIMPVAPAYGGGYGGGGFGYGGDWWLILILLFAFGGWGNGGFGGGFGNMALGYDFPWILNGQQGINTNTNTGFQNALLNDNVTSIRDGVSSLSTQMCNGFGNVATQLCGGFAGVNASINGAQNALAQQLYTNQIADLERSYNAQTATTQGMNAIGMSLQNCCCENRAGIADLKYTVATENCADRTAAYQNTRDIIDSQTNGTQKILDKLCQLELDGVKAQVDAKNDRIAELQTQLNLANLAASQVDQTAQLRANQATVANQLVSELRSCPIPSQPVYGNQPIFTCGGNNFGCGCNGNF